MFIREELPLIKKAMNAYMQTVQDRLHTVDPNDPKRVAVENQLIMSMAIVSKIEKSIPDGNSGFGKNPPNAPVLVVDDSELQQVIMKEMLNDFGFTNVHVAPDGERALAMMEAAHADGEPYVLVLCDWEMPKMTGLELLKKTRFNKDLWQLPFYLVTTRSDKEHILTAIKAGVSGYVVKPVNEERMEEKLWKHLPKKNK